MKRRRDLPAKQRAAKRRTRRQQHVRAGLAAARPASARVPNQRHAAYPCRARSHVVRPKGLRSRRRGACSSSRASAVTAARNACRGQLNPGRRRPHSARQATSRRPTNRADRGASCRSLSHRQFFHGPTFARRRSARRARRRCASGANEHFIGDSRVARPHGFRWRLACGCRRLTARLIARRRPGRASGSIARPCRARRPPCSLLLPRDGA